MNPTLNPLSASNTAPTGGQTSSTASFVPKAPTQAPSAGLVPQSVFSQPKAATAPRTAPSAVATAPSANGFVNGVDPATYARLDSLYRNPQPTQAPSTPININPTNSDGTINSSSLSSGAGYADLYSHRNKLQTLSDNIYKSSLFTPEEFAAKSKIVDLKNKGLDIQKEQLGTDTRTLDYRDQINKELDRLATDGHMTKEQAAGFLTETNRQANNQLTSLQIQRGAQGVQLAGNELQQGAAANVASLYELQRGNQLGAFKTLFDINKPEALAPGSQLVNPLSGESITQGMGVNPAVASTYASQLFNDDLKTGTQHLLPDGSVDTSYYFQKAQGILGGNPNSGLGGGNYSGNATQLGGLPSAIQPYVTSTSEGQQYISAEKVPAAQQDYIKQQAASNGVPFLSVEDVAKTRSIDVTKQNLQQLGGLVTKVLGSGLQGRVITGMLTNPIKAFFQSDADISSFNTYRDTAINTIQALAGGSGSGFRLNESEIKTATSNLPTINDNIETANQKLALLNGFLDKWKAQVFGQATASSNTGVGGVIQTKVGAIDPNF